MYQKKAFFILLMLFYACFIMGCNERYEKNITNTKISNLENVVWSEVRKDTLMILEGCKKLLREFPESPQAQVTAYLGYANYFEKKNDNKNAKTLAQRALELTEKSSLPRELAYCHIQLSEISSSLNNLNEVSMRLQTVEEILNKYQISDTVLYSKYHVEKGLYFRKIQQYEKAIAEFNKILVFAQKKQLFFWEAQANFYISWMYSETSRYEESEPYIEKATALLEKHYPSEVADMYYEKALVKLYQNKNKEAEEAILRSKLFFERNGNYNKENKGITSNILGDIYKNQGLFNQAKIQYDSSLKLLKKPINIKYLYASLFNYYEKTKQFQSALTFQRKYLELKDSLFSNDLVNKANDFEFKYRLSLKEKENLENKQRFQNFILMVSAASLAFLLVAFFIVHNNSLKVSLAKKEIYLKSIEGELKERKLATNTLFISQQNQLLNTILLKIEKLMSISEIKESKEELTKVVKFIKSNKQDEVEWDNFKLHFDSVSPSFFNTLKTNFPNLTELDLKHCVYIKINFTPKQVAHLLGISPKSVTLFRVRLKKKLNLPEDLSLNDYLRGV